MKKFNQDIQVSISIDAIAKNLLTKFNTEFAHAETMVETIIGIAINTSTVDQIYNVLNGYTITLDFQVGQQVKPLNLTNYQSSTDTYIPVEEAIVIEIDTTRANEKVKIEYLVTGRKDTKWVNHRTLENIVLEEA